MRATLLRSTVLLLLIAGASLAQADEPVPLPADDAVARPPLPYDPFPVQDLVSGAVVEPATEILTPDADGALTVRRQAGEYYDELNALQAKLNDLGFSLKDPGDLGVLARLPVDRLLIERQIRATAASLLAIDAETMTTITDPEALADAVMARARAEAESRFSSLYQAAGTGETPPAVRLASLDPEVVAQPSSDLTNVLTKEWSYEKGEKDKFAVTAGADLALSGSLRAVEATARSRADVFVFDREMNVVYGDAQGRVDAARGALGGRLTWQLVVLGVTLEEGERGGDANSGVTRTSADEDTVIPAFREGKDYYFSIGPVPMSGTIGMAGTMEYDWSVGVAGMEAKGAAYAKAKLGGFASLQADVVVAQAGVGGELTLADELLEVEGAAGLAADPANGEPRLVTSVKGTNTMTVLKGELYAFASAVVPAASLPPWEKKTWRKVLYGFDGFTTDEQSLFNFSKIVTPRGYLLTGAPRPEDYAEVEVETELVKALDLAVDAVRDDVAVARGQALATATAALATDLERVVAESTEP